MKIYLLSKDEWMPSQLLILTKLFFVMVSDDGHNDDGDDD